jgi:hypothetical protein
LGGEVFDEFNLLVRKRPDSQHATGRAPKRRRRSAGVHLRPQEVPTVGPAVK